MEALESYDTTICPGFALGERLVHQPISTSMPLHKLSVQKCNFAFLYKSITILYCVTCTLLSLSREEPLHAHAPTLPTTRRYFIPQDPHWVGPGTLESEDGKVKQVNCLGLGLQKGEGAGRQSIWLPCFSNSLAGRLLSAPPSALLEERRSDKKPSRQAARNQKFNGATS